MDANTVNSLRASRDQAWRRYRDAAEDLALATAELTDAEKQMAQPVPVPVLVPIRSYAKACEWAEVSAA